MRSCRGVARHKCTNVHGAMHLLVGLRSAWKCVEVSLQDGSVPVIGGETFPECNTEPALWFKVHLILDIVHAVATRLSSAGFSAGLRVRPLH